MTLNGRTVVIAGATGPLGARLAADLAGQGANLALIGHDQEKLSNQVSELHLPGRQVLPITADLLDAAQASSAAETTRAHFDHIDALLHIVGGWTGGKLLAEVPAADLELMLNQHVWTTFHAVQAFAPHLLANGWGRVVMISSPFAQRPNAKGGPYAIGKAAQEALALTLAQELKPHVTVNLLLAKTIDVKGEKLTAPAPSNASWTTLDEISAAVQYLLSDEAGNVTGARLPLFGG
jgi:NAD(P)-dependent dehydrogenase (short-subunit alcohol dehydrogenase family)